MTNAKRRGAVRGVDYMPVLVNGNQIGVIPASKKAWGDKWDDASRILGEFAIKEHSGEFRDGRSEVAVRCAAIDRFLEVRGLDPKTWELNDKNAKLDATGYHITLPLRRDDMAYASKLNRAMSKAFFGG